MPARPNKEENGDSKGTLENDEWHYRGRPEVKAFLYEIVANKISEQYFYDTNYTYETSPPHEPNLMQNLEQFKI